MIMTTIIASGKREFIPRTSCVPATSKEDGTVARVTAAVRWWFRSTEDFKWSVWSVGASDVPGKDQPEQWETQGLCLLFQVSPPRCLHQYRYVHWLDSGDFVLARQGGRSYFNLLQTRSQCPQWCQHPTRARPSGVRVNMLVISIF